MSERDSLLAAIYADPDDDATRLVFADWLDDHGEPDRAEYIRLQLRSAGMDENDSGRKALVRREEVLWDANAEAWNAEVPTWPGVTVRYPFRRGWPESVECTAAAFLRHGAKIVRHL